MWILAPAEARVWIEKLPSGRSKTYEPIRPKVRTTIIKLSKKYVKFYGEVHSNKNSGFLSKSLEFRSKKV